MIDIDFFKADNDHHGHQRGDQCLERVAAALRQTLRGGSAASLIDDADRNLYRAKEGGRNQVRGLAAEAYI